MTILTLENVVVKDNKAEANYFYVGGHGGGIYMDTGSKLNLIESQIHNNVAEYNGGGIFMDGDGIQIIGDGKSSIHHNEAEGSGGGIYMEDENGLVDNLSFYQNIAPAYKGTIYINGENNKISNLHLSNNAYLTTYEVIVDNDYTTIENCNIEGQVYTTEDIDKGFYIKGKTNIELLTINKNCYVNFELTEGSEVFIKLLYEDDYTDGKARRLTEGAGSDKFGKNSDYYHQGQESHKYVFYHSWTHYIAYNGKPEYQKFNIVKEGYSNPDLYGVPYVPDKQVTLQYLDYNTGNIVAQTETRTVSQSETLNTVISEVPNYEFIGWDTRRDGTGYPIANELDTNPNKSYSFDVLRDGEVLKAWYKPIVNKITVNMSSPIVGQTIPSISKETICASLNQSVVRNAYIDPSNIEVTWNPSHAQAHGDTEYSVTLKLKYDNQDNGLNIYRSPEDEKQNVRGYFVYGVDDVDTSSMSNVKDVVLDKQNNSITITFKKTPDETPEETRIVRVYDIEDITADYGTSDDELQRLLPKDVGVEFSNEAYKPIEIEWHWDTKDEEEDPTTGARTIKVEGTLQLDSSVIFDPGQDEVSINIFVKGKEQVAKPVANKPTGIYNNYFDLELTTTTEGATIYYAVDNNGELSDYQIYEGSLNLEDLVGDEDTVIIYAYAQKDGFLKSDLTILGYLFTEDQVATPIANNYSDTYNNFFDLELSTETEGATIYYSYDYGDTVIKYKGPINLENLVDNNEVFILVYAVKEGMTDSEIVELKYKFKAATAQANKDSGTYNELFDLELSTETEGATIYYSTDGGNTYQQYTGPIDLKNLVDDNNQVKIKAYVAKDGMENSDVVDLNYKFDINVDKVAAPEANKDSGTYNEFFDLILNTDTAGATIYYSTDNGATYSEYNDSIKLEDLVDDNQVNIKVYAAKDGMENSDVVDLNYRFEKIYYPDREIKTWTKGDSQGQSVIFKASIYDADTYGNFDNLLQIAKGSDITPQTQWSSISSTNYTIKPGSLIVDFKKEYLETLDVGDYIVKASFKDGEATVILRIYPKTTPPTPEPEPRPKPVTPTYVVPKTGVE